MPSGSSRRRSGVGSSVGLFRPITPHFVKVVLSESLQLGKLQIPPKFATKYGHNLSGAVKLKLRNGDVWSVKLEHSEGKLWLGKGWRKLQVHYCLKKGSLLLFHSEGEGRGGFHVSIFDRSCSEIDYPVKITPGDWTGPSDNSISSESDDSLEIDDSCSADSMPSGWSRRRRGARSNVGFFRPKSPHFVKVMLAQSIQRGEIKIPSKFARKYVGNFSKAVELKVPSNDAWLVRLKFSEDNFWLQKGWKDFQSHHHLDTGSLLLFQLDGNSAFRVLIFDQSGTEIDYPLKDVPRARPEPSNHFLPSEMEDESDDSLAGIESDSELAAIDISDGTEDSLAGTKSDSELAIIDISDSSSEDSMSSDEQYEYDSPELEGTPSRRLPSSAGKRCFREALPPSSHKALKAAEKFKTKGFSFHIQMRKSYMRSGGVSISKKIMMDANIDEGFHRVELRHAGRAWPVKMLCYEEEHRGKLCRGWYDFLKGNDVHAGDVCVFELLETNVFDVHIIRCP